jgi:putative flippase GtrA
MHEEATMVDVAGAMVDVAGASRTGTVDVSSGAVTSTTGIRAHVRLLDGMRHPANWLQLIRFGIVGASGFVLNLVLYALFVHVLSIDYHLAAILSWTISAGNNFVLNRHWTFDGRHENARAIHGQGVRFLLVSLVALGVDLLLLMAFVDGGLGKVPAQAIAVALSMPVNFLGNKLWTFRHRS